MGSESVAISRSVRQFNKCLLAVFYIALKETSISFPKNLVGLSVMSVVPLDNGNPFGTTFNPLYKKEIHLDG